MSTKNIVPRAAHEGSIGTDAKPFLKVFADEIGGFSRMTVVENECWGISAGQFAPLFAAAVAAGTLAVPTATTQHPGLIQFKSSTTANSGYQICSDIATSQGDLLLAGGETFSMVFRADTSAGTTTRLGFHRALTITDPTCGVFIEIVNNALVGRTTKSGAGAGTATTETSYASITDGVFYRVKIAMNANASLATFSLYTCADGVLVWTDTLATYIPTTFLGIAMISTNSGTTAVALISPDWYRIACSRVLVR